ncbi:acyl-protein thioesterase [Pochonia chlamydosporia 170]|uniref:Acyl-protein thioesterase n=1 Tax=Pochonia chlamydosporia 170 TaxID=1380566 RepID=A0A179F4V2_METCM|nr:acyl-protein thioesterase [Pochonia chlamydosporia 170]OAQ60381.1 acyl-protein thioesterase [Pochonia chlamydosporia 170]
MSQPQQSSCLPGPGEPIFIVNPTAPHTYTLILLHGLGSNGEKFGAELLQTGVSSSGHKLTALFPGARFVFPTSKRRRSSAFGRSVLTQWFDIARLEDPSYRQERQLQGLAESAQEIMDILANELKKVPPQNLIIGGLSQGCAMSLAILLSLKQSIGGYIGMCGYLTYQSALEIAISDEDIDEDNPFYDPEETEMQDKSVKAQTFQRDLLSLQPLDNPMQSLTASRTPVFLGHGSNDNKVPIKLGLAAANAVQNAGYTVMWKRYEGEGHWYKIPDEIDDIIEFIVSKVGWQAAATSSNTTPSIY